MEFNRQNGYFIPDRTPAPWRSEVGAWVRRQTYYGRSSHTIANWGKSIQYFAIWLASQDRLSSVEAVRTIDIEEWLIALRSKNSSSTQLLRYKGLKSFFEYLLEEDLIPKDPFQRLKPPSTTDSTPP